MTVASTEIMTTTITDEQKTEFCRDLHTVIDLVNSLQRSVKLTEMESENGMLNSDAALVEHIGGALGDFLEKFEGLPANI